MTIALIVFTCLHTFLDICMGGGELSQIFDMGPSPYIMKCRNESSKD